MRNENWLVLSSKGTPPRYRKEILRVGKYTKATDGIQFEIDVPFLDHLAVQFSLMKTDGVKVPVPMGHSEAEGNNKGWLQSVEREGDGLYGIFEFTGIEASELNNYDVSVYIPPKFMAGNGKEYQRPIRHVALTAYPVIPGLERFEAIAASLVTMVKEKPMPIDLKKLGTDLGIQGELTEENASGLLLSMFEGLNTQLAEAKRPVKKPEDDLKALASAHPGLLKLAMDGRTAKVDGLLLGDKPKINKVVRDELVALFCNDENIALSLDEKKSDFDRIITILSKNDLLPTGESTGPQTTLSLSDPLKTGEKITPLQADIQRRKKAKANS